MLPKYRLSSIEYRTQFWYHRKVSKRLWYRRSSNVDMCCWCCRNTEDEATPQDVVVVSADDKVKRIGSVKLSGKIKSLSFCSTATKQVKVSL